MWNVLFSAFKRIASPHRLSRRLVLPALLTAGFVLPPVAQAAAVPTVTTLALSPPTATSPVATLTATVVGGGAPITTGSVTFCDSLAPHCEDAAVVGTAQLTAAGTATIRIIPAGTHAYIAIFSGTAKATTSSSNPQPLTVLYPTTTTVTATGNPTSYALTATVVGFASEPPILAGSVTFQDTTNNNTLLGTVPLGPPTFAQSYKAAPGSPKQTGANPAVAGVGDFNEDGIPDLAVVNAGDDTVSILKGNGDGTFTLLATLPSFGNAPCASSTQSNCAIAVGDFDSDGHSDLALTSGSDNTLTILKGKGDGTFKPFNGSPIGNFNYPEAVKIGDFNNDGIQDLVVANAYDDSVSILLGVGDGTFTPASGSPISSGGQFPFFIAIADFNHDGYADLAVVNGNGDQNNLSILQGKGDGTFMPFPGSPIQFPPNVGPCPVVAADFNGDGYADLAVANFNDATIDIFINKGDGTFTPTSQSPFSFGTDPLANPFAMTALDYNSDGVIDLAVANYSNSESNGTVDILVGDGKGSFTPTSQSPIAVGTLPNDVVTADFNGDGKPDLAIPQSGDTTTAILLNTVTQTAMASLPNVILPGAGVHVVKATYPANTEFASSFGILDLQGLSVPNTLTLSANPPAQLETMAVTFTAKLAFTTNQVPTGNVSFFDGGVLLGTATMSGGQAAYPTSSLNDGVHNITATYSGDLFFVPSTSAALPITISDLQPSRVGNNNTTILPGTTVVYTIQVAPQVATTFLYNVALSASGLPAGASASFSPATLAAGGKTATVTMTVTTLKTASNAPPPSPYRRLPLALGLLLPLFGAARMRRRIRQIPPLVGLALLAALSLGAVVGLNGCSGAGLFAARKVPYSITVTATEGTLGRSTGVPLAIQ